MCRRWAMGGGEAQNSHPVDASAVIGRVILNT